MSNELPGRCCGCVGVMCCHCGEAPCPADGAHVLRPGDTLLVQLPGGAPLLQQQTVADRLRDRLPGVDVLVLAAEGIYVYRPDTPGGEGQRP